MSHGLRKHVLEKLRREFVADHDCPHGTPPEEHGFPIVCLKCEKAEPENCHALTAEYFGGELALHCARCGDHVVVIAVRGVL